MEMVKIGITGKAGAGKDTLAQAIMSCKLLLNDGFHFRRLAYADLLKKEAADATGIPIENFYNRDVKEHYRPLLQWWGTEYRRNEAIGGDNEYWLKAHDKECNRLFQEFLDQRGSGNLVILVPDVRFNNEAQDVDYLIEVNAVNKLGYTANSTHVSENGVSPSFIHHVVSVDHALGKGYDENFLYNLVVDGFTYHNN